MTPVGDDGAELSAAGPADGSFERWVEVRSPRSVRFAASLTGDWHAS